MLLPFANKRELEDYHSSRLTTRTKLLQNGYTEGLGPSDLCCVTKIRSETSKPSALETKETQTKQFFHHLLGLYPIDPSTVLDYAHLLQIQEDAETQLSSFHQKWTISSILYCSFNAFDFLDIRIEINLANGSLRVISTYAVTTQNKCVYKDSVPSSCYECATLCGLLRLQMPSPAPYTKFLTTLKNKDAANALITLSLKYFHRGDDLGVFPAFGNGTNVLSEVFSKFLMLHFSLDEALKMLVSSKTLAPLSTLHMSQMYYFHKHTLSALSAVSSLAAAYPEEACMLHFQAKLLRKLKRFDLALRVSRLAVELRPTLFPFWINLVSILLDMNEFEEMLIVLNTILNILKRPMNDSSVHPNSESAHPLTNDAPLKALNETSDFDYSEIWMYPILRFVPIFPLKPRFDYKNATPAPTKVLPFAAVHQNQTFSIKDKFQRVIPFFSKGTQAAEAKSLKFVERTNSSKMHCGKSFDELSEILQNRVAVEFDLYDQKIYKYLVKLYQKIGKNQFCYLIDKTFFLHNTQGGDSSQNCTKVNIFELFTAHNYYLEAFVCDKETLHQGSNSKTSYNTPLGQSSKMKEGSVAASETGVSKDTFFRRYKEEIPQYLKQNNTEKRIASKAFVDFLYILQKDLAAFHTTATENLVEVAINRKEVEIGNMWMNRGVLCERLQFYNEMEMAYVTCCGKGLCCKGLDGLLKQLVKACSVQRVLDTSVLFCTQIGALLPEATARKDISLSLWLEKRLIALNANVGPEVIKDSYKTNSPSKCHPAVTKFIENLSMR